MEIGPLLTTPVEMMIRFAAAILSRHMPSCPSASDMVKEIVLPVHKTVEANKDSLDKLPVGFKRMQALVEKLHVHRMSEKTAHAGT